MRGNTEASRWKMTNWTMLSIKMMYCAPMEDFGMTRESCPPPSTKLKREYLLEEHSSSLGRAPHTDNLQQAALSQFCRMLVEQQFFTVGQFTKNWKTRNFNTKLPNHEGIISASLKAKQTVQQHDNISDRVARKWKQTLVDAQIDAITSNCDLNPLKSKLKKKS